MEVTCPHCGASLSTTGDAFCSDCFCALDESATEMEKRPITARESLRESLSAEVHQGYAWPRVCGGVGVVLGLLNGLRGLMRLKEEDPAYLFGYVLGSVIVMGLFGLAVGVFVNYLAQPSVSPPP
jgi:hypothetical protein